MALFDKKPMAPIVSRTAASSTTGERLSEAAGVDRWPVRVACGDIISPAGGSKSDLVLLRFAGGD
jgi:hypothetical protein